MQNKLKGFTLIELLVVIAIIGILSGLIIVSMSGATNGAKDARIKEDMHQWQQLAALYSNAGANTYGTGAAGANTNFTGTGEGLSIYNDLYTTLAAAPAVTFYPTLGTSTAYCLVVTLNTKTSAGTTQYECLDSTGKIDVTTTTPTCAGTNSVVCQ